MSFSRVQLLTNAGAVVDQPIAHVGEKIFKITVLFTLRLERFGSYLLITAAESTVQCTDRTPLQPINRENDWYALKPDSEVLFEYSRQNANVAISTGQNSTDHAWCSRIFLTHIISCQCTRIIRNHHIDCLAARSVCHIRGQFGNFASLVPEWLFPIRFPTLIYRQFKRDNLSLFQIEIGIVLPNSNPTIFKQSA